MRRWCEPLDPAMNAVARRDIEHRRHVPPEEVEP
jgi:hypothetical protein